VLQEDLFTSDDIVVSQQNKLPEGPDTESYLVRHQSNGRLYRLPQKSVGLATTHVDLNREPKCPMLLNTRSG
jgi:hypothetical protein